MKNLKPDQCERDNWQIPTRKIKAGFKKTIFNYQWIYLINEFLCDVSKSPKFLVSNVSNNDFSILHFHKSD